jgi:hypothetical protein
VHGTVKKTETKTGRKRGNGADGELGGLSRQHVFFLDARELKISFPRYRMTFSLDKVPFNGCLLMGAKKALKKAAGCAGRALERHL